MKAIKFIAWLWGRIDSTVKVAMSVVSMLLVLLISVLNFGAAGFLVFLGVFLSCVVLYLSYLFGMFLKRQWAEYNRHLDNEQQEVVNRLRGFRTR